MRVRKYNNRDIAVMTEIWNEAVDEGNAFENEEKRDVLGAEKFFSELCYCGVAVDFGGNLHGLYTLKKSDEEGKAEAAFAVRGPSRNMKAGADLVNDCLKTAKSEGFASRSLSAVVEKNPVVSHLCEKYGFTQQDDGKFVLNL
jgi:GNAT superfamily N-acetyltransferase